MPVKEGLYRKFDVYRKDGSQVEEFTFTLIAEHDPHAKVALLAYADSVELENSDLASELRSFVASV